MAGLISKLAIWLTADTTKFETGMARAGRKLTHTQKLLAGTSAAMLRFAGSIGVAVSAAETFRTVISTTIQLDKGKRQLDFISESAEAAAKSLEFLKGEARRTGQIFAESIPQYAQLVYSFRQAGISQKEAEETFKAIGDAAATFAMSQADVNGVLTAFIQVASKGKVQAEELRGQIGERIPGAFGMAAESIGVTTQELSKMLEDGKVLAKDLLPAMSRKMREAFGEGLEERSDNIASNIGRLRTEIQLLIDTLNASPSLNMSVKLLTELVKAANATTAGAAPNLPGAAFLNVPKIGNDKLTKYEPKQTTPPLPTFGPNAPTSKAFKETKKLQSELDAFYSTNADIFLTSMAMATERFAVDAPKFSEELKNWKTGLEEVKPVFKDARTWMEKVAESSTVFADSIVDGLSNAARDGKSAIGEMSRYIQAEIQKMLIKWLLFQSITGLGGLIGGGAGKAITTFGQSFGGGRASGGPVSKGGTYLVGERGPELVTMGANGYVTPNNKIGGPTIYADMRGASVEAVQRLWNYVQQVDGTLEARAVGAVNDAYKRNPRAMLRT